MNKSTPGPIDRHTRRLLWVWVSVGVVLILVLGIEALFLLRPWKHGTSINAKRVAMPTEAGRDSSPTEGIDPANPLDAPSTSRPRRPARVPNDNFANRFALGTPAHVTGANAGASNERGERIQNTRVGLVRWGDTLWWTWTAPTSGPVIVDTIGSSYDTYLAIYTGVVVNALSVIAENDNASEVGIGESLVTFHAQEATDYQIQVGGVFTAGGRGSIPVTGTLELNLVMPPAITIDSTISNYIFSVGSNITMNVTATSVTGSVTNVSLYRGATLLGSASESPCRFAVSNAPPGTNAFYAVARDSNGQVGTSAVVSVLVANTGITITAPSSEAVFPNTKPIALSAFPMLLDGSITNVSFFIDEQLIEKASAAPFSTVWNSVIGGSHRLMAHALDSAGNTYDAVPLCFAVSRTFFPTGSVWKYLDNGSDQGDAWQSPDFNDSSWKSGPAELGYGDKDEATRVEDNDTLGFDSRDTEHYITTYFRRAFVVTNIAEYSSLTMNVKRDDGAVVYLNGREAARFNMNTGPVNHLTLARNAGDDGKVFIPATAPASFLVEGTNVVAVEIHQATADSTDISFEMDLSGVPAMNRSAKR